MISIELLLGETFSFSASTVKEEVVTMKFKLVTMLSVLLIVLAACNSGGASSSSENHLKSLHEGYPEVKTEMEKLPEEFRNELTAPDMDAVPFDVAEVQARANTKLKPYDIELMYVAEGQMLSITQRDEKGKKVSFGEENVELEEGIQASYVGSEQMSKLTWMSDNGHVMFNLHSVVDSDGEKKAMTKEELIESQIQ